MDETSNSLLANVRDGSDQEAWAVLLACYTPFLRSILLARGIELNDLDDVMQNVFAVVVRRIPEFERLRTGSFRTWLRAICANCLREHFRKHRGADRGTGESKMADFIRELADPASDLSQYWDEQHDAYLLERLLDQVKNEFTSSTFQAFRRLAIGNERVDDVASDLGITVNAAFVARSRVLKRLRNLAVGMID